MVKKHSQKNQQVLGNIWRVVLKTVVWGLLFLLRALFFYYLCRRALQPHWLALVSGIILACGSEFICFRKNVWTYQGIILLYLISRIFPMLWNLAKDRIFHIHNFLKLLIPAFYEKKIIVRWSSMKERYLQLFRQLHQKVRECFRILYSLILILQ